MPLGQEREEESERNGICFLAGSGASLRGTLAATQRSPCAQNTLAFSKAASWLQNGSSQSRAWVSLLTQHLSPKHFAYGLLLP